jgi:hypothetical protein
MEWIRRLFRREKAPPRLPPEPGERLNPLPAETAVQWSAEHQAGTTEDRQEWMEKGEPDPRRRDDPDV